MTERGRMKGPWIAGALVFVLLAAVPLGFAETPAPLSIPVCAEKPQIDGVISAGEWDEALVFDTFFAPGGKPGDIATRGYVQRSATHLYVAWVCMEPEMDKIVMKHAVTDRDGAIWRDDCVAVSYTHLTLPTN